MCVMVDLYRLLNIKYSLSIGIDFELNYNILTAITLSYRSIVTILNVCIIIEQNCKQAWDNGKITVLQSKEVFKSNVM